MPQYTLDHVTRPVYPRPPIIEATIKLGFGEEVSASALVAALRNRLGEQYPDSPAMDEDGIGDEQVIFLSSAEGLKMLSCSPGTLSIHVLAPYPGWENFMDQARDAVAAVAAAGIQAVQSLSVRYIDRITFPDEGTAYSSYLTVMPPCPDGMPTSLQTFYIGTRAVDPDEGHEVTLVLTSTSPDESNRPRMIIDIAAAQAGAPLCNTNTDKWILLAEKLHKVQRDVFEGAITDKMRELFL